MNAKDVIRKSLDMSDMIVDGYLKDLHDADLLVRPVPGMNNIAWQLGHLISSERHFVELVKPGTSPALPADFEEGHGRDKAGVDDPSKFYTKDRYLELWKAQRAATRAAIDSVSEADLDRTDEKFPQFAPTVADLLNVPGAHTLMHCGQWVAVRRKLGKPVTM